MCTGTPVSVCLLGRLGGPTPVPSYPRHRGRTGEGFLEHWSSHADGGLDPRPAVVQVGNRLLGRVRRESLRPVDDVGEVPSAGFEGRVVPVVHLRLTRGRRPVVVPVHLDEEGVRPAQVAWTFLGSVRPGS